MEQTFNNESLNKIEMDLQKKVSLAKDNALSEEEYQKISNKMSEMRSIQNQRKLTNEEVRYFSPLKKKKDNASIQIETIMEAKRVMEILKFKPQDIFDNLAHENAHANKAVELEATHHGYEFLLIKRTGGEFDAIPRTIISMPEEWNKEKKDEVFSEIILAPDYYGNKMSNTDKKVLGNLDRKKYNPKIEIGTFSDIEGIVKYEAFRRAIKNDWSNEQNREISENIKNKVTIDVKLVNKFREIEKRANYNKETLKWLAFIENKDDSTRDSIIKEMVNYKDFKEEDAKKLMSDFSEMMRGFSKLNDFSEELTLFINNDIKERQNDLNELKVKIDKAIDFFKPENVEAKKIIYLPTNPLEKKESGNATRAGNIFYINAEKANEIGKVHEFLHNIINPTTDQLNLSKSEEKIIIEMCPKKLKGYKYPISILTEEIIRTYKTGFTEENKPIFENFKKELFQVSKNELAKAIISEKEKYGSSIANDVNELLNNDEIIKKYFDKKRDVFSEKIWNLFEDYKKNNQLNFEDYFLKNYKNIFKQ